jgi:hypothetical protein
LVRIHFAVTAQGNSKPFFAASADISFPVDSGAYRPNLLPLQAREQVARHVRQWTQALDSRLACESVKPEVIQARGADLRINAGTLALGSSGSISTSSVITVAAGATLDVATVSGGFALGNTTVNGNLIPGSGPGILNFSSALTLGPTANLQMEINGNGTRGVAYDGIDVTGPLTYGGNLQLTIASVFAPGDYTFDLFQFGSKTGNFTSVTLSGAYNGNFSRSGELWTLSNSGDSWTLDQFSGDLSLAAIPEPSTWAFLALAAGALFLARSRRYRKSFRFPLQRSSSVAEN